jgi:hypothetical protein
MSRSKTGIPGLSFSWRRASGLTRIESEISRKTGIPLTRSGREKKMGRIFMHLIGWMFLGVVGLCGYEAISHPDIVREISGIFSRF